MAKKRKNVTMITEDGREIEAPEEVARAAAPPSFDNSQITTKDFEKLNEERISGGGKVGRGDPGATPLVQTPPEEIPAVLEAEQKAADARNVAAYGTANPTIGMILKRLYAATHNDLGNFSQEMGLKPEDQPAIGETLTPREKEMQQRIDDLIKTLGLPSAEQTKEAEAQLGTGTLGESLRESIPDLGTKAAVAGAGIATTALAGGPVSAGIGAASIIGAGLSVITNLKSQEQEQTELNYQGIFGKRGSVNNIKSIIDGVNKGYLDPVDAINLYNQEIARIDQAERNLKLLSERDWLTKAKPELDAIETFNRYGKQNTYNMLMAALVAPNAEASFDISGWTETTEQNA